MKLRVNGAERELPPGTSIPDLLAILEFESVKGVAVAVNGEVVPRDAWEGFIVTDGMVVEVLRAVQGG